MRTQSMDLEHFADMVFRQNKNDMALALSADLRSVRDCFCFCLDLLCKGLILLYGKEVVNIDPVNDRATLKKRVDLENLDMEKLDFIKGRMLLCGIKVHTQLVPVSMYEEAGLPYPRKPNGDPAQKIGLPNVDAYMDTDPLEAYKVDIWTGPSTRIHIQLHFELTHVGTGGMAHGCHWDPQGMTNKRR